MNIRALFLVSLACVAVVTPASAALPVRRPPAELLQEARARMPKLFAQKRGTDLPLGAQSTFTGCGTWTELSPDQAPFYRYRYTMVYDSARDRLLILGGYAPQSSPTQIWALSLGATPSLTEFAADNSSNLQVPTAESAAIYDPVRDRVVLLGGFGNGTAGSGPISVFALSLSGTPTWNDITPGGSAPENRFDHAAIYDVTRDRMVVFGGSTMGGGTANDVWAMSFSGTPAWTQLTPSGTAPAARRLHTAVYDGPRDRMVIYGGYDDTGTALDDVQALSLAGSGAWSLVSPNGGPPTARGSHSAIVDTPRNRMIVFAGYDNSGNGLTDVWTLSFTNPIKWTNVTPAVAGPNSPYDLFQSVYDPVRQRMLSLMGDQFWALEPLSGTAAWTLLAPPEQTPLQRWGAVSIYDAPRHRMVVFGGRTRPDFIRTNDVWAYALPSGPWSRLLATGSPPSPRDGCSAIFDPTGNRMILFGGADDVDLLNQTWQLTLSGTPAWTLLSPSGTPPAARTGHSAILDTPRNRMIVYGGTDFSSNVMGDTWSLSLSGGTSWSHLTPTGSPPASYGHSAVFDPVRNRMLAFGLDATNVWTLALTGTSAWTTLTPTGTAPQIVGAHVAAYDAVRDRALVALSNGPGTDTYALTLAGTPNWGQMGFTTPPPVGRTSASSVYDTANDRWVMFGGQDQNSIERNDVQALSFPNAYPLTVAASPTQGGSVQESPQGDCQPAGSMVTLTAVPAANYTFTGWSGDASGTTNPLTVTMNAAKNITANFDNFTLTVTVSPSGAGTVARNPNLANYPPNSTVTLTASAFTGYGFTNWSGDASGSTNPLDVVMSSSKNITANFTGYPVNVTVSPAGSGTVTKNPNQATYAPGTQVTLTAGGSFTFVGWSGDASGNTNPLTITVDGPKNITATFNAYSLTTIISPAGAGTVTRSPNQTLFSPGAKVELSAQPIPGYSFSSWSGDLTGANNPDSVLMNANKTVTATFVLPAPVCGGWGLVPTPTAPPTRVEVTSVWDPVRHRMLVYGGHPPGGFTPVYSDTWGLSVAGGPSWTQVEPGGTGGRYSAIGVYDPVRDRLIIYGGFTLGGGPFQDAWALTLTGTPTWSQLVTGGPSARSGPSLIYDPPRDRLLLFGGNVRCGLGCGQDQNDVWQLSLSGTPTWTQLFPTGTPPPPRSGHGAIYDPVRDRMVVFGGSSNPTNGAWALSLSGSGAWTDLTPTGVPHVTNSFKSAYDPIRDRVLVILQTSDPGRISTLDFSNRPNQPFWCQMYAAGPYPSVAGGPATVYDPDDDLVLVTGPSNSYRLDLSGGLFLDTSGINGQVLPDRWCYSSGATAMLLASPYAGFGFDSWSGDASGTSMQTTVTMNSYKIVQASFSARATGVEDSPIAFGLEVRPNPAVGPAEVDFSLPRPAKVRLSVFDIAGREVERLADGPQPPGRHTVVWGQSRGLRAGIYLVRFETPAGAWTKRLALLR